MPNRLAAATSPYLLQHQTNPVDWHEWGDEPFQIANTTDRPVMLSVGYSSCHWCHVMAHESFEDEQTAAYLNEHFVSIKVDREERPDIDRIYMDAVQAMTGHGGWPMTVFLTPAAEPFTAGTYFPREPRGQMPSFRQVLEMVTAAWNSERGQVLEHAARLTDAVRAGIPGGVAPPAEATVERAIAALARQFDGRWGGFGSAPKFPQAPVLELLVAVAAMEPNRFPNIEPMIRSTLDAMRAGGIYDQLGGGFARYAVDERWLIPHFEKMLYDNALLATVYLRAGQLFTEPSYLSTARETLDYLAATMRDRSGGIHSAEDADSEGVEGKFYLWTWEDFQDAAGADAPLVGELYGVTREGNFEGANHLHIAVPIGDLAARHGLTETQVLDAKTRSDAALAEVRSQRVLPGRDDKIIAAWNGLALRSFAEAGAVLDDGGYLEVAVGIAEFIEDHLIDPGGRLLRSWRRGAASGPAFCVDYGAAAVGLFALYQATGNDHWYRLAERLTNSMIELFSGDEGFFTTAADAGKLIARPRDFMDNPLPSANALAADAISTLGAFTGRRDPHVEAIAHGAGRLLDKAPNAVAHLLGVLYRETHTRRQVAIVGPPAERRSLERVFWERYRPDAILAAGTPDSAHVPLLNGRLSAGGPATAHVCQDFSCELPVTDPGLLRQQLAG